MEKQPMPFNFERGQWPRFGSYYINNHGEIVPENPRSLDVTSYCPFDYYWNPVPEEIAQDIFAGRRMGALERPFYLHTLFASLDPANAGELLAFVNHFGLPYFTEQVAEYEMQLSTFYVNAEIFDDLGPLRHSRRLVQKVSKWLAERGMPEDKARGLTESLLVRPHIKKASPFCLPPGTVRKGIALKTLAGEVEVFRWVVEIGIAYTNNEEEKLKDLLIYGKDKLDVWVARSITLQLTPGWFYGEAEQVLSTMMRIHLRDVRPVLNTGTYEEYSQLRRQGALGKCPVSLTFGWEFDTLLTALYLMLFLDLTGGKLLRRCANPLCGRFFVAARANSQYCSAVCQNRAKQRRFKRRHKGVAATVAATRAEKHENDR